MWQILNQYFMPEYVSELDRFLKHFDELLEAPFIRVHRSFIVNLNFIKSYSKGAGGYVTLADGSEIEVSSTYKDQLLKTLGAV